MISASFNADSQRRRQEQATVKAQVAGVMAGADTKVYESLLGDIAVARAQISAGLARAEVENGTQMGNQANKRKNQKKLLRRDNDATLVARALAEINEVLNAPDSEITPAEKQGLLARVVDAIYPDGKKGVKINLKPSRRARKC